jgi:hypothetical protein
MSGIDKILNPKNSTTKTMTGIAKNSNPKTSATKTITGIATNPNPKKSATKTKTDLRRSEIKVEIFHLNSLKPLETRGC